MRSIIERSRKNEGDASRELELLAELQSSPHLSQRRLATRLGISLGATNLLLRSMMRKGHIRMSHAHWRRWLYALTPTGFYRKVQLTLAYVQRFLDQYQQIRGTLRSELEPLGLNVESRVAIYGTGELAEMVYLGLQEFEIEEVDIFGPASAVGSKFLGMTVNEVASLRPDYYDRVIVGELTGLDEIRFELSATGLAPKQLVVVFSAGLREASE